ncbi:hypothetical protein EJ08DRAFT_650479 [Tothia fuscella]|uniref:Uncharacterized protein n=1 Tax=Tothia fuscella TaxID=1048955 RepID=A0A9P4NPR7_9PEZI|nr:hypothetical protein EJ08DRAFT_650479 [Tothia fuscella]
MPQKEQELIPGLGGTPQSIIPRKDMDRKALERKPLPPMPPTGDGLGAQTQSQSRALIDAEDVSTPLTVPLLPAKHAITGSLSDRPIKNLPSFQEHLRRAKSFTHDQFESISPMPSPSVRVPLLPQPAVEQSSSWPLTSPVTPTKGGPFSDAESSVINSPIIEPFPNRRPGAIRKPTFGTSATGSQAELVDPTAFPDLDPTHTPDQITALTSTPRKIRTRLPMRKFSLTNPEAVRVRSHSLRHIFQKAAPKSSDVGEVDSKYQSICHEANVVMRGMAKISQTCPDRDFLDQFTGLSLSIAHDIQKLEAAKIAVVKAYNLAKLADLKYKNEYESLLISVSMLTSKLKNAPV